MATQTLDIERELSRDEKSGTMHSEHMGGLTSEDADFLNNFPEERKKAVVRKVDVSVEDSVSLIGVANTNRCASSLCLCSCT